MVPAPSRARIAAQRKPLVGVFGICPSRRGKPVTQGWTSHSSLLSQNLPRDHQPLDFTGTFANRAQLHIAIKFLRRIILDETVAAVNLYRFIRYPHGHFSSIEFRHARFASEPRIMLSRRDRLV